MGELAPPLCGRCESIKTRPSEPETDTGSDRRSRSGIRSHAMSQSAHLSIVSTLMRAVTTPRKAPFFPIIGARMPPLRTLHRFIRPDVTDVPQSCIPDGLKPLLAVPIPSMMSESVAASTVPSELTTPSQT